MKRRFWIFSRERELRAGGVRLRDRRGGTLLEAIAGLVVLGTLLVSIAVARGRFVRQRALAEQRIAAAGAVDRMVGRWMGSGTSAIPVSGQGTLEGVPNSLWRTRVIEERGAREVGAQVVRVEVFDRRTMGPPILVLDVVRAGEAR